MMDLTSLSSVQCVIFGAGLLRDDSLSEEMRGFSGLWLFWASLGLRFASPRSVFTLSFPKWCLAAGPDQGSQGC